MMMSEMAGSWYSDAGQRLNEDAVTLLVHQDGDKSLVLGCVADGVGGNGHGDLASAYIIEQMNSWFDDRKSDLCSANARDITMAMYDQVMSVHNSLVRINEIKGINAGSTLSLMVITKGRYVILHVGDSRIYLYNNKEVTQLTKDQTQAQRERDLGHTNDSIDAAKERILLQAMGIGTIRPQVYEGLLPEEYQVLLCSDGLSNLLEPADIAEILDQNKTCKANLKDLSEISRRRGEKDNISALLITRRRKEADNA